MARAASIYDFTLTAGGTFVLPVEGSYYRIMSSTGAVEVRRDGGAGLSPLIAGQGERDQEFSRLTIKDKSGAVNSGYIICGDMTFIDDRINGEVLTVSGGVARTLAGLAFMGGVSVGGATGLYSHAQLWNPATSTRVIVVTTIYAVPNSSNSFHIRAATAAIANMNGNVSGKLLGTNGAGEIRYDQSAGLQGSNTLMPYLSSPGGAGTLILKFDEPIVLMPGNGIILVNPSPNSGIGANFELFERPL